MLKIAFMLKNKTLSKKHNPINISLAYSARTVPRFPLLNCFSEFPKTLQLCYFIWHEFPYFWSKKFNTFCIIKNCMYRWHMKSRLLSKIVSCYKLHNSINDFRTYTIEIFKHLNCKLSDILVVEETELSFSIVH